MAFTVPTFSKTLDDQVLNTWFHIREEIADNVLNGTPVWALMRERLVEKVGGADIPRTIRHTTKTVTAVARGDTLPGDEPNTKTRAAWLFRWNAVPITADLFDDQENAGVDKVVDYVEDRIQTARDALPQKLEEQILGTHVSDESGKEWQTLNDIVPTIAQAVTGTYGGITRPTAYASGAPSTGNTFWGPKYRQLTTPYAVNLVTDMRKHYNDIGANLEDIDTIISDQTLFELYEAFGLSAAQQLMNQKLVDLGFQSLKFKGADMIWSANQTANFMHFLNRKKIDIVYDPRFWFMMTEFKPQAGTTERQAHILLCGNVLTEEPRRHGGLYA